MQKHQKHQHQQHQQHQQHPLREQTDTPIMADISALKDEKIQGQVKLTYSCYNETDHKASMFDHIFKLIVPRKTEPITVKRFVGTLAKQVNQI